MLPRGCRCSQNNLKVAIIQAIDRKINLEELAEVKGLDFDDLIDELESIVESGTKIDIDYYIDEVMDEDLVEDIIDYFMEQEEDNLDLAIQEMGEVAEENDIRLIRIKFLSEMGN